MCTKSSYANFSLNQMGSLKLTISVPCKLWLLPKKNWSPWYPLEDFWASFSATSPYKYEEQTDKQSNAAMHVGAHPRPLDGCAFTICQLWGGDGYLHHRLTHSFRQQHHHISTFQLHHLFQDCVPGKTNFILRSVCTKG